MTRRVLVVEDERTIAESVAARLRAEGFEVEVAHDGPAAVARARDGQPDLVVLDVMLPGFDGLEVCRRIQAERPVPVLMLTARDDETDLLVGLAVGADDYLTKPFSMRELAARVHALLRRVERAASPAGARITVGDLEIDLAERRVRARRRRGAPDADRVRPAGAPGRAAAGRAAAGAAARRGVGLGGRLGDAHGGQPHQGAAPQARRGPDPDGARRRLRPGGAAMSLRSAFEHDRWSWLPRPLDPVRSIKLKLGILLVSAAAGFAFFRWRIGWLAPGTTFGAVAIVLVTSQVLAHGMTRPLREMTAAARAMAAATTRSRVRATARDEVGELAARSTRWRRTSAAADQQRRELIANVSHELRTPITALQAVLENIVDGVAQPDPATMRTALAQTERLGRLVTELLDLSRIDAGRAPVGQGGVRSSRRCWTRWCAEASVARPAGCGSRRRLAAPDDASYADRDGCTRWSRTCWTTRPGTARRAATVRVTAPSGADLVLEVGRRGPGHRAAGPGAGLRALHPGRTGHGRRHRAWASPSPAGWSTCTAARSPWSTHRAAESEPPSPPPAPPRPPRPAPPTSPTAARPERTGAEPAELPELTAELTLSEPPLAAPAPCPTPKQRPWPNTKATPLANAKATPWANGQSITPKAPPREP